MKFILSLLLFLLFLPAATMAQDAAAPGVPTISFMQQVEIVVAIKKDPRILEMKIVQDKDNVNIDLIVDKNEARSEIRAQALNAIMRTKAGTLDDPPKKKDLPGKGVYNYRITISQADGVVLTTAFKPKAEEKLQFQDPFVTEPVTRADEAGR